MNLRTNINFEWDPEKERVNIQKHKIDFRVAAQVFDDENAVIYYDERHSDNEDRYIAIGCINERVTVVTVVYTMRPETYRIISARLATKEERKEYIYGLS